MHKLSLIILYSFFALIVFSNESAVKAQTAPASEIFFLDLGIAIEPSSGSEKFSRSIDKPSEEVAFKVKKVESGSVYMASSEELINSLNRLNSRIEQLEKSFNDEIVSIREKNDNLKTMLADVSSKLTKQQIDFAAIDAQSWRFIKKYDKFANKIKVFDQTEPTPGLPFITSKPGLKDKLFFAIKRAIPVSYTHLTLPTILLV